MGFTRGKTIIASITMAVLIVGAGAGIWAMFFRDEAPPPVSLADAVASVSTATPTETTAASEDSTAGEATATSPAATATASDDAATSPTEPSDPTAEEESAETESTSGSAWAVAADSETFVGYRIGEELANIGTSEAVGRTSTVNGSVEISGTQVIAASIEANLADLTSDDSRRDNTLGERGLETNTYPTATFVLSEPIELGSQPVEGAIYSAVASGELTLHGVTQPVEITLEAQFTNGALVIVGSLEIALADYDITAPTTQIALSVDDHGTLELQLILSQSAG